MTRRAVTGQLRWGNSALQLTFSWSAEAPVHVAGIQTGDRIRDLYGVPVAQLLTVGSGHVPASDRLVHTELSNALRYTGHTISADGATLSIEQSADDVVVELRLQTRPGIAAVRSSVRVANRGAGPLVLRAVPSWTIGFTSAGDRDDPLAGWERVSGASDWLGEGRWDREPLRGPDFPRLAEHLTGHNPRGAYAASSSGSWSTGRHLPVAALENRTRGECVLWQIEHNGAWRWEIGEDTPGGYVSISGPTDADSAWTRVLGEGDEFRSVPVTVVFAADLDSAVAELTDHRRATRRAHPDNAAMPVVFNDYMNTLNGDPTTEKLLPLIAAAAEAGCEVFCIDAGWYDDSGNWWDSVGEWMPSTTRFPNGLAEVIDAIRDAGLVPGLWLEPEVVGVRSPIADSLPAEAFLLRHGQRVVEHHRYHLDLRHPAAVAHLDAVVDRLIGDFGIGFFKFDYNIDPGAGTDHEADSAGDGLLEHNRAHLAWLDGVLDRHPDLVIENCASGAMRMDFALLSRLAMQSTSDQQDFVKYPPIAAAAPLSMLPEQAASWAYPQPEMTDEEISFALVTGLLGRYYVSGYLNRMTDPQRRRVADAIAVAKELRTELPARHPLWPLGLPSWDAPWVALGLRGERDTLVSVWRRDDADEVELAFPHLVGRDVTVATVFPTDLPAWDLHWDPAAGSLRVHADDAPVSARTLRLTARAETSASRPASPERSATINTEGAIQ